MKATAIFCATAVRYLRPGLFAPISPFELVEAIAERYHFKDAPSARELAMLVPQSGLRFFYGRMEAADRPVTIEQLVAENLDERPIVLSASTRTATDDADAFLDDLLAWAKRRYGIDTDSVFPAAYRSVLQVRFEKPVDAAFAEFQELGRTITHLVQGYGSADCPRFELSGISLNAAASAAYRGPAPVRFSLERTAAPADEASYLAEAPLRTQDHERLLAELEKLFSGRRKISVALMQE